jgi:hypothetical protein
MAKILFARETLTTYMWNAYGLVLNIIEDILCYK